MNNIISWFSRKNILLISVISCIVFLVLIPRKVLFSICNVHNSVCVGSVNYLLLILMFGVAIFIPSIIMFFVKQETFESWRKITFSYYIYIYLVVLIFVPWYSGDEFLHIEKDIIAMGVSVCYVVFSLFLIFYKSLQKDSALPN